MLAQSGKTVLYICVSSICSILLLLLLLSIEKQTEFYKKEVSGFRSKHRKCLEAWKNSAMKREWRGLNVWIKGSWREMQMLLFASSSAFQDWEITALTFSFLQLLLIVHTIILSLVSSKHLLKIFLYNSSLLRLSFNAFQCKGMQWSVEPKVSSWLYQGHFSQCLCYYIV